MSVRPLLPVLIILAMSALGGCASPELVRVDHGVMRGDLGDPAPSVASTTTLVQATPGIRFGAGDELGALLFAPEPSAPALTLALLHGRSNSSGSRAAPAPDAVALAAADSSAARMGSPFCHLTSSPGAAWGRIALRALTPRWLRIAATTMMPALQRASALAAASPANAASHRAHHAPAERAISIGLPAPRAFGAPRRCSFVPSPAR